MAPASRGRSATDHTRCEDDGDSPTNGFDLPPSTMAAQLINNLSTPNRSTGQNEQEDLKKLLKEISSQEDSGLEFQSHEAKLKYKHKLVYVCTRAVLERLAGDDPFVDTQRIAQASDALEVLMTTIKEVPEVLIYYLGSESGFSRRGQEPLWVWLFPRVLVLLGHRQCGAITEKIKDFFHACFQVVAESPTLWNRGSLFFCYFKNCVTTMLNRLGRLTMLSENILLDIYLPADEIDQSMFSYDTDGAWSAAVDNCVYVVKTAPEGIIHVASILCILVDVSVFAAASYNPTPAYQNYMAWMLDAFFTAHVQRESFKVNRSLVEACGISNITSLTSLQAILSASKTSLNSPILKKGYIILSTMCADFIVNVEDLAQHPLLLNICSSFLKLAAICKEVDPIRRAVSLHLLPTLQLLLNDDSKMPNVGRDFQKAAVTLLRECQSDGATSFDLPLEDSFDSMELDGEFRRMGLDSVVQKEPPQVPAAKRRKIQPEIDVLGEITTELYSLLGSQCAVDLDGLDQVAQDCFAELNEKERCRAFELLAMLPCAANNSLSVTRDNEGAIRSTECELCDGTSLSITIISDSKRCQTICSDAVKTFNKLLKSPAFVESRRPRVLAMIALKNYATHFHSDDFINLTSSEMGQWCVGSLKSSSRELRISAGRTLARFLSNIETSEHIIRRNRELVLELLRSISDKDHIHLQETWILTWGQIGRILNDDGLGLVLLRLVEFMGHANPIISAVACNEIVKLASAKNQTPERMFNPFWDDVAIAAVKGLLVRPQTTQLMADLLGITIQKFLILTQSSTLPHLVLSGQVDVIAKIMQARGETEVFHTCMETSNFAPILSLLMVQNIPDVEALITSLLRAVSPDFKSMSFADCMRSDPAALGVRLLKAAGQAPDSMKSRIHMAFRLLASSAVVEFEGESDHVASFLSHHILGFMARFGEVVNDLHNQNSVIEKIRCIKGVEEMVKIGKKALKVARPQVCALLQQALAQPELQAAAFSAWERLLYNLDDDSVETMLEITFSLIIQRWDNFTPTTRQGAESTLQYLLKQRTRLIRNMIVNLPSLSQFPQLKEVEKQLNKIRTSTDVGNAFTIFSRRVSRETPGVVTQALVELKKYLQVNQSFLQASAVSEQPDAIVGILVRSILDACVKFNGAHCDIAQLSAECIGLIGCLDPNRVESIREQPEMVVVSNFGDAGETTDFVLYMLKEVIVKAFLSATDTGMQGFLSLVMQRLLEVCNFKEVCPPRIMKGEGKDSDNHIFRKWIALPESVQETLIPFLTSRFNVKELEKPNVEYPVFRSENALSGKIYRTWLTSLVLELLYKPYNRFAELVFPPFRRAVKIKNLSIATSLFPYVVLHVIVEGTDEDREKLVDELLRVLKYQPILAFKIQEEDLRMCSEAVFRVLDYLSRWIQARQLEASKTRGPTKAEEEILLVRSVLDLIPAELVSQRAIECRSYSRALFYWEQHIRQVRDLPKHPETRTALLQRVQDIYTQIDEPDGIEGISAHLHVLDIDQQILAHRKAGRWTAAQSWYEIKLADTPDDVDVQVNLLTCLKESGQHDVLLNYVQGMHTATKTVSRLLPFATEASWATGRWAALEKYTKMAAETSGEDFNISVGRALLALHQKDSANFTASIRSLREHYARSLTMTTTPSLSACHSDMLKFHVLTELEMIAGTDGSDTGRDKILESLNKRLEVVGAYLNDKQYLLGIRRAAMQLSSLNFTKHDLADAWLTSARLARKGNAIHQSFNAVLHASKLGDESAMIEHARLLMREGHHRKAIQSLKGAIASNAFIAHNKGPEITSFTEVELVEQQNLLTARAHLLYAKWLDSAGQTHSSALRSQYQLAARTHNAWEKGHYYLGRHYNKLLESEKTLAPGNQTESYLIGETAKLVIENYMRSLSWGTKYIYQTLPRILTLWLDLGSQVNQALDAKYGVSKEFIQRITQGRKEQLAAVHSRFNKYITKLPAYVFYTAMPQIMSRITHQNQEVFKYLHNIITKVISTHPQQALWSLLAVATSTQSDRKSRGITILQQLRASSSKRPESGVDMRVMLKMGERLTSELLQVCVAGEFPGNRTTRASITQHLGFNHKTTTPNLLAVPFERVLTATLPTLTDKIKEHKAFSRDVVTIDSFLDEVLILSSLQKPRKLTARGSDGKEYGLLCKPKDDLRKDQRLMEFNSMINRSLKRDAESSKRQLYIKTYAVTPLNEECGIIEWVDGLKTLRDILLGLYRPLGISPDYREIERHCEEALKGDEKMPFFTEKVLGRFPPIFHQWFVSQFPEPSAWFAARLRYTRSCAVMSMVGTILGLGDRHGENILFEEGNGGTFHVDFNCLFDKGLTFVKPERVPFRLTHNMIDAMGIYGYEGPFRKSSELTLKLLRQHEETLMTILEAFVYDPTLDLVKKDHKKKKEGSKDGPQTAQGVLDTIQRKVKGLLPGESVPLGVEGQVDELIGQATNLKFLAGMYIGWCSFF